jgi:diguanylate cyclase (GGDEF)-like protein
MEQLLIIRLFSSLFFWQYSVIILPLMNPLSERLASVIESALPGVNGVEMTRHLRRDASIATGVLAVGWALFERAERRSLQDTMAEVLEERDDALDARDAYEAEALTDPLTGLPNFRALMREFNECVVAQKDFGIVYADIDAFKAVNDELGHAAGDAFLTMTGSYLLTVTRPEDDATVTRKGGDEYAVLVVLEPREDGNMQMAGEDRLTAVTQRMKKGFKELPEISRYNAQALKGKKTGITLGSSLYRGQSLPTMLNEADPKGELGNKYLKLVATHTVEVPSLYEARADFAQHLTDKPSK